MALTNCPECNHRVSDKAAQCPSCGYNVQAHFNASAPATPSSDSASTASIDVDSVSPEAEMRFREEALKIVTACNKAINSPRFVVSSMLEEAEGMLGVLRSNYSKFFNIEKYADVGVYLMGLVLSCKSLVDLDESLPESTSGGLESTIMNAHRNLVINDAQSRTEAYTKDLRIILGASPGVPNAVAEMNAKDREKEKEKAAKPADSGCLVMLSALSAFGASLAFVLMHLHRLLPV